jgi:E3 ubiquitin-protein ligase TRIP12
MPGMDDMNLIENGQDMPVTISNLDQYVDLVWQTVIRDTLTIAVDAFRIGFQQVLKFEDLNIFMPEEIPMLYSGVQQKWTM